MPDYPEFVIALSRHKSSEKLMVRGACWKHDKLPDSERLVGLR
jgi:hypothetical protein